MKTCECVSGATLLSHLVKNVFFLLFRNTFKYDLGNGKQGSFCHQVLHTRLSLKGAGPHSKPGLSGVSPRTRWGTIVLHHASIIHREPEKVAKCVCLLNN